MPLTMKCRMNDEKGQIYPTNLDRPGKTGGYLQLCSFTFCTAQTLYLVAVVDVVEDGSWKLAVPNL